MTLIAVYIATTAGPVRIERIVGETVPQSNVFVGRGYKPLEPVSADYDDFVAPGGPVARAFGPFETASFRLDVSGPIDTGNSWELAVFVAHGLAKAGRLASPGDDCDAVFLLTGRVDADLGVGAVGHIGEKISSARGLISENAKVGRGVIFYMPVADGPITGAVDGMTINTIDDARAVLDEQSARPQQVTQTAPPTQLPERPAMAPKRHLWRTVLIAGIAIGGIGYAMTGEDIFTRNSDQPADQEAPAKKPPTVPAPDAAPVVLNPKPSATTGPRVDVFERRPPPGKTCLDVHFGDFQVREQKLDLKPGTASPVSLRQGLCGLRIRYVGAETPEPNIALLTIVSGRFVGQSEKRWSKTFAGETSRTLDLPGRSDGPIEIEVSVAEYGDKGKILYSRIHKVIP